MHRKAQNLADAARVCEEKKPDTESEQKRVTKYHVTAERQNYRAQKSNQPQCVSDVSKRRVVVRMLEVACHAEMLRTANVVGGRRDEKREKRNPYRAVWAEKLKYALHA